MAKEGEGDPDQLTRKQIVRLAAAISADNMESIAEGYMDISDETIKNIRRDASNSEAFNRDVIRHWMYRNPEHQVEVCFVYYYRPQRKVMFSETFICSRKGGGMMSLSAWYHVPSGGVCSPEVVWY